MDMNSVMPLPAATAKVVAFLSVQLNGKMALRGHQRPERIRAQKSR